ncbi:MAG: branched-chain amino acid ABC transporter permease [Leucobacter sp.]
MEFLTGLGSSVLYTLLSPTTAAFVLAAIGLNIHFGFTGLMNFGQAGFMLLGAYGFGVSVSYFGLGFWPALLVAIAAAVVFALILGIPTLKLRGDYLAIVTIAAAEILRMIFKMNLLADITGASSGLHSREYRDVFSSLSPLPEGSTTILGITLTNTGGNDWWTRIVGWALVALFLLIAWLLIRSPWGRVLKGIREDEDAVRSLGKSSYAYKMQALVIGGVMGAFGGIIWTLPSSMHPDMMGRAMTFNLWMIVLLGGAATIFGPLLGTLIFFALRITLVTATSEFVPSSILTADQTDKLAWALIGVALMLLVIFRPQGILGNKKELSFNV